MIESDKERQAPKRLEDAEPTHLARYKFAMQFIEDEDIILDVPCGSGYGSFLLTEKSKKVYGIDICSPAIDHANELFSNNNNCFLVCNMQSMSIFKDDYFDVVVSFEGIEHIKNPDLFLKEVKRILKPDGKLIISTPKKPHGSQYHIIEFNLAEFNLILSKYFKVNQIFGQIYTDIFNLEESPVNPDDYKHFNFIGICSNIK
jgi:ubiquinone/menaquinone biosynthesis C-methylase UbiE